MFYQESIQYHTNGLDLGYVNHGYNQPNFRFIPNILIGFEIGLETPVEY